MLKRSVKILKGVGEVKAKALEKLGISTMEDLINHYPRRYEDLSHPIHLREAKNGEHAVFLARVMSIDKAYSKDYKNLTRVRCEDDTVSINIMYMGLHNAAHSLVRGELYWFSATVHVNGNYLSAFHAEFLPYANNMEGFGIRPIYPLSNGLNQADFYKWLKASEHLFPELKSTLPEEIEEKLGLMSMEMALHKLHFPSTMDEAKGASKRLMAEELYARESRLATIKALNSLKTKPWNYKRISLQKITELFPYQLTESQLRSIEEISRDLYAKKPMTRLLFGDVGSGKTAVAVASVFICISSGYQACLLAPTEILAHQHYKQFCKLLGDRANIALLTSSTKDKDLLYEALALGEYNVVIATHAVLQEGVSFDKLALIITDEEHRFGVKQKLSLLEKSGEFADSLSLSATPIPRTLTKAYYGDMDLSYLDEVPSGRLKIITKFISVEEKPELLGFIAKRLRMGEQAYFILPRIEEDAAKALNNVSRTHAFLQKTFSFVRVGLLHGLLSSAEKNDVLKRFAAGEIGILVATSVVEVGIDVANATMIVISDAEQFGLSQLHQLRGRVGRGTKQSFCFLTSAHYEDEAKRRIDALQTYSSGYDIAQMDLKLRGPGDVLGIKQHGFGAQNHNSLMEELDFIDELRTEVETYISAFDKEKLESFLE